MRATAEKSDLGTLDLKAPPPAGVTRLIDGDGYWLHADESGRWRADVEYTSGVRCVPVREPLTAKSLAAATEALAQSVSADPAALNRVASLRARGQALLG